MMPNHLHQAVRAAQGRKALELSVLDLGDNCSFADFFLICTGTSTRHTQAICDAIRAELERDGVTPAHVEGYRQAEWILLDYLHFVVHIFSERSRHFYDLERLWRTARRVAVPENGD